MGTDSTVDTRGDTLRRPRFRGCLGGYVRGLLVYSVERIRRSLA